MEFQSWCFEPFAIHSDKRLKLEKCQLWNSIQWPFYVINTVDNTKLPFYTLLPMQHHGFFRNYDLLWFADQQHKKVMFAKTQTKKKHYQVFWVQRWLVSFLIQCFPHSRKPTKNAKSYLKLCRRHRRELVRFLDISRFLYSL